MSFVVIGVVGVDQDVIEVDENAYIQEISRYTVHKMLEAAGALERPKGITRHSKEP